MEDFGGFVYYGRNLRNLRIFWNIFGDFMNFLRIMLMLLQFCGFRYSSGIFGDFEVVLGDNK